MSTTAKLSEQQQDDLLSILEKRFNKNIHRHPDIMWNDVAQKLRQSPHKLWSVSEMENTGGEPDVVQFETSADIYFVDCSAETPKHRRSVCYDREALESRKDHPPANSAIDMAESMGIKILDESQYFNLQKVGPFDQKTSSWLKTPPEIRSLGGALFGDFRYNRIFIYHNGAQSYYGVRGFRGCLKV